MTIVSIKTETLDNAEHFKLEFSDGSLLYIKDYYLSGPFTACASLQVGMEIKSDEEESLRFAGACFLAEQTGRRLIARAEQNQAGLSRKLEKRGHDSSCVSAAMAFFIENNLVNDERYAEYWLRSRLIRKTGKINGPRLLSAALENRGIGREALKKAFTKALDEESEFALLMRFMDRNGKKAVSGPYSLRGRLRYEGFSSTAINRYFDEAVDKSF